MPGLCQCDSLPVSQTVCNLKYNGLSLCLLLQVTMVIPVVWAAFHNWWYAKKSLNTVCVHNGWMANWWIKTSGMT